MRSPIAERYATIPNQPYPFQILTNSDYNTKVSVRGGSVHYYALDGTHYRYTLDEDSGLPSYISAQFYSDAYIYLTLDISSADPADWELDVTCDSSDEWSPSGYLVWMIGHDLATLPGIDPVEIRQTWTGGDIFINEPAGTWDTVSDALDDTEINPGVDSTDGTDGYDLVVGKTTKCWNSISLLGYKDILITGEASGSYLKIGADLMEVSGEGSDLEVGAGDTVGYMGSITFDGDTGEVTLVSNDDINIQADGYTIIDGLIKLIGIPTSDPGVLHSIYADSSDGYTLKQSQG